MGLADLHIHSVYSYDGTAPVAAILNRAQEVGLNVIAITDHDEIKGSLKAFDLAPRFVTEKIEPNLSLIGTILKVGEAGGICIAPHPMARGMGMKSLSRASIRNTMQHREASRILLGIETYNATALDLMGHAGVLYG